MDYKSAYADEKARADHLGRIVVEQSNQLQAIKNYVRSFALEVSSGMLGRRGDDLANSNTDAAVQPLPPILKEKPSC